MSPYDPTPASARLALVGAGSLLGKEIKGQLAATGFPGDALGLFDLEEVAGMLTDYGDQARVLLQTVAGELVGHELVCFCDDHDAVRDHLAEVLAAGHLALDCTGACLDDEAAFAWIPGLTAPPSVSEHRAVAIPPAASLLVGGTMAALGTLTEGASANVFVPASEMGDAGMRELSQQATAILNLLELDCSVFGRQMAFDMWLPAGADALGADRLAATLRRLGLDVPAINVVSASVFHGMALSMFIPGAGRDEVVEALRRAGFHVAGEAAPGVAPRAPAADPRGANIDEAGDAAVNIDSPVQVVGIGGIHAVRVRPDAGGAWLWAVADNLHSRATAAVAAVHALIGSAVSDQPQ